MVTDTAMLGRPYRARAADAITGAMAARARVTAARTVVCPLTGPVPAAADTEPTPIHDAIRPLTGPPPPAAAVAPTPIHDAIREWNGPITTIIRLPKAV